MQCAAGSRASPPAKLGGGAHRISASTELVAGAACSLVQKCGCTDRATVSSQGRDRRRAVLVPGRSRQRRSRHARSRTHSKPTETEPSYTRRGDDRRLVYRARGSRTRGRPSSVCAQTTFRYRASLRSAFGRMVSFTQPDAIPEFGLSGIANEPALACGRSAARPPPLEHARRHCQSRYPLR